MNKAAKKVQVQESNLHSTELQCREETCHLSPVVVAYGDSRTPWWQGVHVFPVRFSAVSTLEPKKHLMCLTSSWETAISAPKWCISSLHICRQSRANPVGSSGWSCKGCVRPIVLRPRVFHCVTPSKISHLPTLPLLLTWHLGCSSVPFLVWGSSMCPHIHSGVPANWSKPRSLPTHHSTSYHACLSWSFVVKHPNFIPVRVSTCWLFHILCTSTHISYLLSPHTHAEALHLSQIAILQPHLQNTFAL